jgi:hypothetical protein
MKVDRLAIRFPIRLAPRSGQQSAISGQQNIPSAATRQPNMTVTPRRSGLTVKS